MKSHLIIALIVISSFCGCTTTETKKVASHPPAKFMGVQSSRWGNLEMYTPSGPPTSKNTGQSTAQGAKGGKVVLDLLVASNGAVMDSAVVESSGDAATDNAARAIHVGAVFPPMPEYRSTAPYIVRIPVVVVAHPEPPSMSSY